MSVEGVNRGVINIGYIPTTNVKFGNFMIGIGLATVAAASSNVGTTYAKILGVLVFLSFIFIAASKSCSCIFKKTKKTALKHLTDKEITIDLVYPITESIIDRITDKRRNNLVTAINYLVQKQAKRRNLNNEDYWRLLRYTDEWVAREIMGKTANPSKPNFNNFLHQCVEQYQEGRNRIWPLKCEFERCRTYRFDHSMPKVIEVEMEDRIALQQQARLELSKQQKQTALMQRILVYFWWHTNPSEVHFPLRVQFSL